MKHLIRYISLTLLVVLLGHCKQKDNEANDDILDPEQVMAYEDGDTLKLRKIPPGLQEWLSFYAKVDTGFRLSNFKASGVGLHMGELPDPVGAADEKQFRDMFEYAPDSTKYIDLVSYNYLRDRNKLISADADQQVVLTDIKAGSRKQLFYFGPSQLAEFASWTSSNSFLVGITSRTVSGTGFDAELMFFHLKDSMYTNFRLTHSVPLDSEGDKSFLDYFFTNRQFNLQ